MGRTGDSEIRRLSVAAARFFLRRWANSNGGGAHIGDTAEMCPRAATNITVQDRAPFDRCGAVGRAHPNAHSGCAGPIYIRQRILENQRGVRDFPRRYSMKYTAFGTCEPARRERYGTSRTTRAADRVMRYGKPVAQRWR